MNKFSDSMKEFLSDETEEDIEYYIDLDIKALFDAIEDSIPYDDIKDTFPEISEVDYLLLILYYQQDENVSLTDLIKTKLESD